MAHRRLVSKIGRKGKLEMAGGWPGAVEASPFIAKQERGAKQQERTKGPNRRERRTEDRKTL
jgi:hypothetical protein